MKPEHRVKISEIIGKMQCQRDFECVEFGFKKLCKAKDISLEDYVECLDPKHLDCGFALSFGHGYLCRCLLRVYLAKIQKAENQIEEREESSEDGRTENE